MDKSQTGITELTVELLSAFVANNGVRSDDLPGLIVSTHAALSGLESPSAEAAPLKDDAYKPAVTVRKSLANRDFIISLIDGKPYKGLKRHLTGKGLTPAEYRTRYNLPTTYPMVAPSYSEARSAAAKRTGLGHKPSSQRVATPTTQPGRKPRAAKQT